MPSRTPGTPTIERAPADTVDDLTRLTGVGPVYAGRLNELGVEGFRSLAGADTTTLAEGLGMSEQAVADWQSQAAELSR